MHRSAAIISTWAFLVFAGVATPALADFSACESSNIEKDLHEKIRLLTICINTSREGRTTLAMAFFARAVAHQGLGERDLALEDFNLAIEEAPRPWGAYTFRGSVYAEEGEWAKAIADFETAMRSGDLGERAQAERAEAWLLATCPDTSVRNGSRAVELAQKAAKYLDRVETHDTLAASYAEAGRFADAASEEAKAIDLAAKHMWPVTEQRKLQDRLELYRAGKPYHLT